MKKYKKLLLSILFLLTFSLGTYAHSSGNRTNVCFLWWKKYHAKANIKFLYKYDWVNSKVISHYYWRYTSSGWVWTPVYTTISTWTPFYSTKANDVKNSCSSVHADAEWFHNFGGSTGWRVGHAGWKTGSNHNYMTTQYSNHWRIKAGTFDKLNVDSEKFEKLEKEGFTKIDVNADVILKDNQLSITNLRGNISIENNSNFYSTYKIIVYKENKNATEKEHSTLLTNYDNMEYINIVTTGAINISKDKIELDGFFKNSFDTDRYITKVDNSFGLDLIDINIDIPLNAIELKDDEILSFAIVADGGLDFSSVILNEENKYTKLNSINNNLNSMISTYPNPAKEIIFVKLPNKEENYTFNFYNVNGQNIEIQPLGTTDGFTLPINNIPNGTYYLNIKSNNGIMETKKIIVSH